MARKRNEEPTKRTAAYRKLLQHEDLTTKMVRRRTSFVLVAWLAALALADGCSAISPDRRSR